MNNISLTINPNKEQKKMNDVPALCKDAGLKISDQKNYEKGASCLTLIKCRYKELEGQRKEITKPIDETKKKIMDLFREPLTLLTKAEAQLKVSMITYTNQQEIIAQQERDQLQKLADQEAMRQKKLIDAKIERAKESDKEERIEQLEVEKEMVIPMTAPVVPANIETPKGVSYKMKYTAEVIDINLVPREYMVVNQSALNSIAQATKGTISIPGVKIHSQKVLASG